MLKREVIHPDNLLGRFLSRARKRQLRLAKAARATARDLSNIYFGCGGGDDSLGDVIDLLYKLADEMEGKNKWTDRC